MAFLLNSQAQGVSGKKNNLPKHHGVGPPEARGPMQLHRLKAGHGYIAVLIVTNKYLERTLLLLNSVYGRGLKHAAREGILCGPRCFLVILK